MKWNPFSKKQQASKSPAQRVTAIRPSYTKSTSYKTLMPEYANVSSKDIYWRIYKNEAPVRGAVKVIVNAICSTGWDVRTYKQGDVDMDDQRVKRITDWLGYPDQPVPFDDVLRTLAINLTVHDDSFVEVVPNTSSGLGWMYPLDTRDCDFQYNDDGTQIVGLKHQVYYSSTPNGMRETILNSGQYVHLALDKGGAEHGLSSIESIVKDIDLYATTVDYTQTQFDENGVPKIHINAKDMSSPQDQELLINSVERMSQGESLITFGDITCDPIGGKISEIDYQKIADIAYQAIMTVFQIPPVLMCRPGESTAESSREETNSFAMNIRAFQRMINNAVNRMIVKIWGDEYADIRFEMKPWINEKAQAAIDEIGIKSGYITPNMILKRQGQPTVKWGDYPYSPNFIPQLIGEVPWNVTETSQGNKGSQNEASGRPSDVSRPRREGGATERKLLEVVEQLQVMNQQLLKMLQTDQDLKKEVHQRIMDYTEAEVCAPPLTS